MTIHGAANLSGNELNSKRNVSAAQKYDTAFRHIKLFLSCYRACTSLCADNHFKKLPLDGEGDSGKKHLYSGERDGPGSMECTAPGQSPVEARDHVEMFHYFFFTRLPMSA